MKLEVKSASFEIDWTQASELFYALRRDLEHTIDTHWNRHPQVYSEQAASRLQMMRELARVLGSDFYASTCADLKLRLEREVAAVSAEKSKQ